MTVITGTGDSAKQSRKSENRLKNVFKNVKKKKSTIIAKLNAFLMP